MTWLYMMLNSHIKNYGLRPVVLTALNEWVLLYLVFAIPISNTQEYKDRCGVVDDV